MPIGQPDIAVIGGNATQLVESLFTPQGSPVSRNYLPSLIKSANQLSAANALNAAPNPYFAPVPALPPPLLPPTIVPFPPAAPVQDFVSLLNPPEWQQMLNAWWLIWNSVAVPLVPGAVNASDAAVLTMIRDYIADPAGGGAAPPLSMWLPQVAFDGMNGEQLKLRLLGYQQVVLATPVGGGLPGVNWNQAAVLRFLNYLAFGAHFVVVHAPRDNPGLVAPLQSFYTQFAAALGNQSRAARAHSHYGGLGPVTNLGAAYAYPDLVNAETAPVNCPYIAALLVGRTAWGVFTAEYNTFFQLEGWPTTGYTGIGGRHSGDYAAHVASKWNISTYGASLYSEKRGTTIFLAPATWRAPAGPQAVLPTIMPPYVGAGTLQGWLDTNLVRI